MFSFFSSQSQSHHNLVDQHEVHAGLSHIEMSSLYASLLSEDVYTDEKKTKISPRKMMAVLTKYEDDKNEEKFWIAYAYFHALKSSLDANINSNKESSVQLIANIIGAVQKLLEKINDPALDKLRKTFSLQNVHNQNIPKDAYACASLAISSVYNIQDRKTKGEALVYLNEILGELRYAFSFLSNTALAYQEVTMGAQKVFAQMADDAEKQKKQNEALLETMRQYQEDGQSGKTTASQRVREGKPPENMLHSMLGMSHDWNPSKLFLVALLTLQYNYELQKKSQTNVVLLWKMISALFCQEKNPSVAIDEILGDYSVFKSLDVQRHVKKACDQGVILRKDADIPDRIPLRVPDDVAARLKQTSVEPTVQTHDKENMLTASSVDATAAQRNSDIICVTAIYAKYSRIANMLTNQDGTSLLPYDSKSAVSSRFVQYLRELETNYSFLKEKRERQQPRRI